MTDSTCVPRDVLKKYLVGAFDEQFANEIESHLESCPTCEQTIDALDLDPDTLIESLREVRSNPTDRRLTHENASHEIETPSVISRAVATARQIVAPHVLVPVLPLPFSRIGAYDLIRPLGRGGMGMVVLARHRSLHKDVAIKLLTSLAGDRTDLVIRFQREMRTAGLLNHPAIVNATDAGQEQGTHYLVMEHVDGFDVSRIVRLTGILSIADACELARQAALGLSHAHAAGVVHRDIKPSNLMIDSSGRVKILDFGLAQLSNWAEADFELTTVGQLMGTLDYMAPEQAERSGMVDYRADLYALGATLFRLLAGRAPLAASPNMTLLDKVRILGTETAPSLGSFRSDCPSTLVELVKQLLSRDPARRPASAAHVAEALAPFCFNHQLDALMTRAQSIASRTVAPEALLPASSPLPDANHPTQPQATSPPRRLWPWVLSALVPLAAWAGIIITLETQKGQLVIQSDIADVHIQLTRDGKIVNELTIQPGAQSTRLLADKYEIRIDSPSDQVVLDKQQFSIKNGETIVATIKRFEKEKEPLTQEIVNNARERASDFLAAVKPSQIPPPIPLIDPAATSASHKGEYSLEEWLVDLERHINMSLFGRDQGLQASIQYRALNSIAELTKGERVEEVTQRLLFVARNAHVSTWSDYEKIGTSVGRRNNQPTLDLLLFNCLRQINSKASMQHILETQLLSGDDKWTVRWFTVLLKSVSAEGRNFTTYSPGPEMNSKLLARYGLDRYGPESAKMAFAYLLRNALTNKSFAEQYAQSLIELANSHPCLGRTASLSIDCRLESKFGFLTNRQLVEGEIEVEQAVARFAKQVLLDNESTPDELALAAGRLATTTEIVREWRTELISELRTRLRVISMNPRRLSALLTERDGEFYYTRRSGTDKFPSTNIFMESKARGPNGLDTPRYIRSEAISYIALVRRLSAANDLSDELIQMMKNIAESYVKVAVRLRVEPPNPMDQESLIKYQLKEPFRHPSSPITWWPFEFDVLKSMGAKYGYLSQSDWIQWTIFHELNSSIPDIKSPMIQETYSMMAEVDMKIADANEDGKISRTELHALPDLPSGRVYQDRNSDGFIDKDEIIAARYAPIESDEK